MKKIKGIFKKLSIAIILMFTEIQMVLAAPSDIDDMFDAANSLITTYYKRFLFLAFAVTVWRVRKNLDKLQDLDAEEESSIKKVKRHIGFQIGCFLAMFAIQFFLNDLLAAFGFSV